MSGSSHFAKVLKTPEVIALAFGAMIGWSWVFVTGTWLTSAGTLGTLIAFAVGGCAVTLIGLTYSELASAMPQAGGEHVYTHRALGARWSFICTWALLFSYLNVCLFESVALPTAVYYLFPNIKLGTLWSVLGGDVDLGFALVGAGAAALVGLVNVLGIRTAAIMQTIVTVIIIVSGILLLSGALVFGNLDNAKPLLATPATGIITVLIMVPALLVGFDVIPQSAEEIDLPPEKIGRLLVISITLAVAWYIAITFAVGVGLTASEQAAGNMATANAATSLWGTPWAGTLLVLGGIGGIMTSWNAFVVGASRVLYALSKSGFVPAVFARLHPRYKTPYIGILAISGLSMIAPLFGDTILIWLINTGSFATTVAFTFVAISFLVLRKTEPDMPRPFRVSHPNLVGYGAVLMSLGLLSAFLPWSDSALDWPEEWITILIWVVLGATLLWRYEQRR
ncbi:MAG: amino acid permease [OM182 bacterium]|nr:MAG: amino acid permease [OM182 bacterium]|tara:strand:- start:8428 stop:9783 length:1356 start_codon:yes stop_codon:yes gene_type:complete